MSQAQYARRLGVSRAAISQWKRRGTLILGGAGGEEVNVEATDANLKRFRRDGLPPVDLYPEPVKRGRPSVKQGALNSAEPARLTCAEVMERLSRRDWAQTFDWSDAAQHQRAVMAARCVGWEAVTSDLRDDGHWGGFQLRIPGYEGMTGPAARDGVAAGHGFELDVWEVVKICRAELEPIDGDDDEEVTVRADLLPVLAHPFSEYDKPQ
jgi:hypothetical protein